MTVVWVSASKFGDRWLGLSELVGALACLSAVACSSPEQEAPLQQTATGGDLSSSNSATVVGAATATTTGIPATSSVTGGAVTGSSAVSGTSTAGSVTGGASVAGAASTTGTSGTVDTSGSIGVGGATSTYGTVTTTGSVSTSVGGTSGSVGTLGTSTTGDVGSGGATASSSAATTASVTSTSGGSFGICSNPPSGTPVVTIHIIGDSTASIYASDLYPRTGWGQIFGDYYSSSCAVVSDKALSGRSSKSFYDEGAWTPVRDALNAGDYVLIQFGHNDEKTDDLTRYTDPQTTFKQYLTTYINDTRAKQATPVLLTPINRNNWDGTSIQDTHGAYPPAMRELAVSLGVDLIDMTAITKAYFERIGEAATTILFMNLTAGEFPNYPDGNSDNTHLRETGARAVATLINDDAYQRQLPLATLLSAVPVAP